MNLYPLLLDSRAERRDSNMELLRIVAMSMILVHHFFFYGGPFVTAGAYHVVDMVLDYGVDIFVLISGWFLIQTTWQSLFRLWLYTLFITVSAILGYLLFTGELPFPAINSVRAIFAPFSGQYLWFLSVYFGLMIIAPILNPSIERMSLHNMRVLMVLLSFFEFYSCYIFRNPTNKYGFNLFNFIYLYYLGRYLKTEPFFSRISVKRLIIIMVSLVAVLSAIELVLFKYTDEETASTFVMRFDSYNAPNVVLVAAIFVLIFSRWKFKSKIINSIASAALGCYILQDGVLRSWHYPLLEDCFKSQPVHSWHIRWAAMCVAMYIGFWAASYLLTTLGRLFLPRLTNKIADALPGWLKPECENNPKKELK